MTEYKNPVLSIAILDFKRPEELARLLDSLDQFLQVPARRVYCHDGIVPDYALEYLKQGRIDTLITTSKNQGCGIQTRQLFQACMTYAVLYCQVDQYLSRPFTQSDLDGCLLYAAHNQVMYVDLAGNQGNGRPSERASLYIRNKYLTIPGIDEVIGGPGPFADHKWTEQHLQEHIYNNNLQFITVKPPFFADNGKEAVRVNPDGSQWKHYPDTKQLWLLKGPVKEKFVYPKFTEQEWEGVIATQKWEDGKIPENEIKDSFHVWN